MHTRTHRLLLKLHTRSQWQRGEAQISPLPCCSLSSLWSGTDTLFLLTTNQNSERRKGVLVFGKHRLKTECEFELQSSTQLWCACATKFNEGRRRWWNCTAQRHLCASAGPSSCALCVGIRACCVISVCVFFSHPSEYSDSIIDRLHWMICLH